MASHPPATPLAAFERWVDASFARHLESLRWSEIARGLVALSAGYVEHRARVARALDGRGKRAAFALYYAPRHWLVVREAASALVEPARWRPDCVADLGCGTGVAGAAFASVFTPCAPVLGADTQVWALEEARTTYRALGISGRAVRSDLERLRWPAGRLAIVAAFTLNELSGEARGRVARLLESRVARGDAILIVEPLAKRAITWWPEWVERFAAHGGRAETVRVDTAVPEQVAALGRSAGLDPTDLGARALWAPPRAAG